MRNPFLKFVSVREIEVKSNRSKKEHAYYAVGINILGWFFTKYYTFSHKVKKINFNLASTYTN